MRKSSKCVFWVKREQEQGMRQQLKGEYLILLQKSNREQGDDQSVPIVSLGGGLNTIQNNGVEGDLFLMHLLQLDFTYCNRNTFIVTEINLLQPK